MSANTDTVSIPNSAEEFQKQINELLSGLNRTTPDDGGEEISDEELAKYLLEHSNDKERSDDKAEGDVLTGVGRAQAAFLPSKKLQVSKGGSSQPLFNGTTADQWTGQSRIGALAYISKPSSAIFYALDGLKIPYVPLKLLVIFFYNTSQRKFAVYVGKAIHGDLAYTSGDGNFSGFI